MKRQSHGSRAVTLQRISLSCLMVALCPHLANAQSFYARGKSGESQYPQQLRPTTGSPTTSAASGSVSSDLLSLYQNTKRELSDSDVTKIARSCSQVMQNQDRSKVDREYATSLLAWALNRRGEIRSDRAAQLVQEGRENEAAKLDKLAEDDFKTSVEFGPKNWRTHHNYAIALAMSNEYQKAISELTQALSLKPDYSNAHFNRGELYFETSQFRKAEKDYSNAIKLDSTDPQYFNSRAHCRFIMENYADALADYRKALELGDDSAVYATDLADAYQFLGQWDEAAESYRKAIAINNQYSRAYQNAAWLMATCPKKELRNEQLAVSAAKRAMELNGVRDIAGLDTLAAATAAAGKFSQALKLQQEAISQSNSTEERAELNTRLELYAAGKIYIQPRSTKLAEVSNPIRAASGTKERR